MSLTDAEEIVAALRELYPIPVGKPGGPSIYAVRLALRDGVIKHSEVAHLARMLGEEL